MNDPIRVPLPVDQARHARRVLRLTAGNEVELFDGAGRVARGILERDDRDSVVRLTRLEHIAKPPVSLDLAVSLPKGSRADDMVNQLSQLGVDRLIPLRVERSVKKLSDHQRKRWQKAAIESAKQCRRAWLMRIEPPTGLPAVLEADYDLRLFADASDRARVEPVQWADAGRVVVLIGPEGGWTDAERHAADVAGARPWSLGPHVMRIETAALAAAAIIRHQLR